MRQSWLRRRPALPRAALVAIVTAGALTACTATTSESGTDDSAASESEVASLDVGAAGGGADSVESSRAGTPGRAAIQTRAVIATGEVTVVGQDLGAVRDDLDRLLGRFGGTVAEERTVIDEGEGEPRRSQLVLRVPSPRFDEMMAAFDDIGRVTETQREEVDVTTEVIDVAARIRTAEVSLRRLRAFLGRAGAVDTVIRLESEIAQREADLASMRAQQDYLDDQTSLATIRLLMQAADRPGSPGDGLEDAGFVTGLRNGWNALLDVVVVAATVVGAMVPFAVVAALVGTPLLLWLRGRRRRTVAPPATPAV